MKKILTRSLIAVLLLAAYLPLFAQSGPNWQLIRHDNNRERLKTEVTGFANRGLVPVGVTVSTGNIYILYLRDASIRFQAWELNWFGDRDSLQSGITGKMREGFIPVGLHFDGTQFFVLFIKTRFNATHWKIMPGGSEPAAIKQAIDPLTADFYVPMDLTRHEDRTYTLLVRIPGTTIRQWSIETFAADNAAITPGIDAKVSAGWSPWGLDVTADGVRILFVK